jgi:cytochrome P450 family 9
MHEQVQVGKNLNVEIGHLLSSYTADGISTTMLGFVGNSVRNANSELNKIVKCLEHDFSGNVAALKFLISSILPKIARILRITIISKEVQNFFKRTVVDVMNERERKNISRPDVIQLLLQAKKGQLKRKTKDSIDKNLTNFTAHTEYEVGDTTEKALQYDDMDWIAQGMAFFGAGFDTIRDLVQITFYELAQNQNIQQTLFEEIDGVLRDLDGEPISFETLHKMKFLDMVVSESLRKWPIGIPIDRRCGKDYTINLDDDKSIVIRKDQIVIFPTFSIQRDPKYFEDPEKYDPYRFSDERKGSIIPGTLMPFGSGPRGCIGSRYALMSTKLILFKLLSEFTVKNCVNTPKTLTFSPSLTFKFNEKIYLDFFPRKE